VMAKRETIWCVQCRRAKGSTWGPWQWHMTAPSEEWARSVADEANKCAYEQFRAWPYVPRPSR
jgi:hypothetical protein